MLLEVHPHFANVIAQPLYVLDWDSIHKAADWELLGRQTPPIVRAVQPRRSPDFNRVAEHFHHAVKQRLRDWLVGHDKPRTAVDYQFALGRLATEVFDTYDAKKDADGLQDLWRHVSTEVAAGGSGGGWPPREMR